MRNRGQGAVLALAAGFRRPARLPVMRSLLGLLTASAAACHPFAHRSGTAGSTGNTVRDRHGRHAGLWTAGPGGSLCAGRWPLGDRLARIQEPAASTSSASAIGPRRDGTRRRQPGSRTTRRTIPGVPAPRRRRPMRASRLTVCGSSLATATTAVFMSSVTAPVNRSRYSLSTSRAATPVLTWIGCAVAPDPIGLNSVRGLPDGGFIASNFLPRGLLPQRPRR